MQAYPFIFSNKYRLRRHFIFWFSWWLFQSILYAYTAGMHFLPNYQRLPVSSIDAVLYLAPHMFLAYSLMYFVVPKLLLKAKYLLTTLSVIALFFATGVLSAFIGVYIIDDVHACILGGLFKVVRRPEDLSFFLSLLAGLRGGITIGGMAAAIKIMKHLYMKEQRNLELQQENTHTKLQLLKAQIHPHFLFNTLNNIYSNTQDTSPVASKLTLGLSDLLRYMLYECNVESVPLNKELKLLKDYITLERIRYGNTLDVNFDVPADADDLYIAPLLLLPFVENTFKHGASQMLDQPWLSLSITVKNGMMQMKLMNGKPENYQNKSKSSGIGIENVRRRLDLLYPEKYSLEIKDEQEVFIVNLKIELQRIATLKQPTLREETVTVYE
jgi:sensor histidine kinase YesM